MLLSLRSASSTSPPPVETTFPLSVRSPFSPSGRILAPARSTYDGRFLKASSPPLTLSPNVHNSSQFSLYPQLHTPFDVRMSVRFWRLPPRIAAGTFAVFRFVNFTRSLSFFPLLLAGISVAGKSLPRPRPPHRAPPPPHCSPVGSEICFFLFERVLLPQYS